MWEVKDMSRRQDLRILAAYANAPEQFPEGNVPVSYAAKRWEKMHASSVQALKLDGFRSDMHSESQEVRRLIITLVRNFFGK